MSAIVALDTETTGLSLDDEIWEFAGIRREDSGRNAVSTLHLFIDHDPNKCAKLPEPFRADHVARWDDEKMVSRYKAAFLISDFMADKAHIVGCVPNFDTERISLLLARFNIKPQWHHHLIDVENLAVGYLAGRASLGGLDDVLAMPGLPWDSDNLSRAIGIEPPTDARHTAMGDALWALRLWDALTGDGAR